MRGGIIMRSAREKGAGGGRVKGGGGTIQEGANIAILLLSRRERPETRAESQPTRDARLSRSRGRAGVITLAN